MMTWGRKKIVDISTVFEDGDWVESKDQSTDGIRLIQTGNVGKGIFKDRVEKARYISEDTFKKLRCTEIFEGDCLVSRLPDPVGRACILPDTGEKMITAVDCTIIRFELKKVVPKWFLYFTLSDEYQNEINKQITGATRQRISRNNLGLVSIPLPPLPEQRRIVSILDEAFSAIERSRKNAEQNLKNAKELFESYLQGVFASTSLSNHLTGSVVERDGWEEKKFREMVEYDKNQNVHKGLPYVGLENIESNSGRFIGSLEPQEVKSSTFHFSNQHVLYGRLRPYLNKVLLPEFEGHCSTEIFPIKVKYEIEREFLFYWLIAGSTVKRINATWTGARMPRANMNQVLEFDFAFPKSKAIQQTIVRQLDALRAEKQKLETIYKKKIEGLDELKKSILQKAFAGELHGTERIESIT